MSKLTTLIIGLLLSLLIGFSVYNFYLTHEYKERTIHTGFRGEARKNPFYASRLFLKRMGIPTQTKNSIQGMGGLPDTNTVLLISTKRSTLSPKRTKQLINWVKSGGHLIAVATKDWKYNGSDKEDDKKKTSRKSPDPLQRFMGIRTGSQISINDEEEEHKSGSILESLIDKEKGNQKAFKIRLKGVNKALHLDNPRFRPILLDKSQQAKTEQIKLGDYNFIARQKVGGGLITLIADMSFIKNRNIEKADHAEILWHLIHGLHPSINQPASVWLIHNDKMPPLWSLLWNNAWAFILSLLFLLIAWLMTNTRRFGPIIYKQEMNRRSLKEHISSSGNYYWKNKQKQKLIDSARKALLQRLAQIYPGWAQRSNDEQIQLLAEQTTLPKETIQRLLYETDIEKAEDFTYTIRQLENIRKAL